jgi:oligopeptide transport system ATP-binding protein
MASETLQTGNDNERSGGDSGQDKKARVAKDVLKNVSFDESAPLLQVKDLQVDFHTREGVAHAVNGVNFTVEAGRTLGILGESGCGKSVTAQAIMGILDMPPARIAGGEVLLQGVDLLKLPEETRRRVRSDRVGMVFQDALSALNPVFTVGWQLAELFRVHRGFSRKQAKEESVRLLDLVGIPDAKRRVDDYPHQFSGGMRQRAMIAMALALDPDVLIADEPTTALDVTVQAQIMKLLADLQSERNMGLILITHDMGVVADVADDICVMYAGRVVERAGVLDIYSRPAHPYAKALLESIPRVDMKGQELASIKGLPPSLVDLPTGCSFRPRCGFAKDRCATEEPPLYDVDGTRQSACHYYEEVLGS